MDEWFENFHVPEWAGGLVKTQMWDPTLKFFPVGLRVGLKHLHFSQALR